MGSGAHSYLSPYMKKAWSLLILSVVKLREHRTGKGLFAVLSRKSNVFPNRMRGRILAEGNVSFLDPTSTCVSSDSSLITERER